MAQFLYAHFLAQIDHELFDKNHRPGDVAIRSGIYRCMGCGREVAAAEGSKLPPHNHHQHDAEQGALRWRLSVYADHRSDAERTGAAPLASDDAAYTGLPVGVAPPLADIRRFAAVDASSAAERRAAMEDRRLALPESESETESAREPDPAYDPASPRPRWRRPYRRI